jgi:serine/threonine protein kinase/outer membrane protein assembly factor BamB
MAVGEDTGIGALGAGDPQYVGGYRLLGRLGEGGMGRVFLGLSPGRRLAAVKLVHEEYASDDEFRVRFRREVQAARSVSGVFTASVFDADPEAQAPWLAVVYVPGLTLHEAIARFGPMPVDAVRALGSALAEALRAIHAAGLVHRDVKPGNILLSARGPAVVDFGISRALDGTRVTRTGTLMGTAGYMPPEQLAPGGQPGPPGDIFAWGAVLAFAATGVCPFGEGRPHEVNRRVVTGGPALEPLPGEIRALIGACLAKDPSARPTVGQLLAWLGARDLSILLPGELQAELRRRDQAAAALVAAAAKTRPPRLPARIWPVPSGLSPSSRGKRYAIGSLSRRQALGLAAVGVGAFAGAGLAVTGVLEAASGHSAATTHSTAQKPTWTTVLSQINTGALAVIGTTLVLTGGDGNLVSLATSTGRELWQWNTPGPSSSGPAVPNGTANNVCGVSASAIFGWAVDKTTLGPLLFTVNPLGTVTSTVLVDFAGLPGNLLNADFDVAETSLCTVSGRIGLFAQSGGNGPGKVLAIDLGTGATLWTGVLQHATGSGYYSAFVIADADTCYIQDGPDTYALNLTSGAVRWHAAGTADNALPSNLTLVNGVLIVGSMHVTALDPADGRRVWSSRQNWPQAGTSDFYGQNYSDEAGGAYPSMLTAVDNTVYYADGSNAVWALDAATGALKWKYTNDSLQLNLAGPYPAANAFASGSLVAVPYMDQSGETPVQGYVALDPATGLAVHINRLPHDSDVSQAWRLIVSGGAVYATSGFTVCAFEGTTR